MFREIVIVNNELMKIKGTPESQTYSKKKKYAIVLTSPNPKPYH